MLSIGNRPNGGMPDAVAGMTVLAEQCAVVRHQVSDSATAAVAQRREQRRQLPVDVRQRR
jgi:hypothetical protein